MDTDKHRLIPSVHHWSTESVASCETVRIMTPEEFAAKHPHPPKPFIVSIDRQSEQVANRQRESTSDRQSIPVINQQTPLCYRVKLSKIDVTQLNALRNPFKPLDINRKHQWAIWRCTRAYASWSSYCGKDLEEEERKGSKASEERS